MPEANINGIKHVAFIMDGNGRWAKKRLMPREYGHKYGAEKFKEIVRYCKSIGIKTVTVYAFSTENWKRPKKEVDMLIALFADYIRQAERDNEGSHIIFLGDKSAFGEKTKAEMEELERSTEHNDCTLCVAMNYGGHAEIVEAVNKLIKAGKTEITEEDITKTICSGVVPPPDMIVRTGGELRLSNFLLWQSSYSELFFTDTLWPDFTKEELDKMIDEFGKRKRRFGGV